MSRVSSKIKGILELFFEKHKNINILKILYKDFKMSLIWYNQGSWITNNDLTQLYDGDKVKNNSSEEIFDLTVHDPNASVDVIAQILEDDERKVLRFVSNGNADIYDYHLVCPYLELKYNTKSGFESEHPVKISFYAKLSKLSEFGFIYTETLNKAYSLHIVKIINDYKLINDTCEINYPFNYADWFKIEMDFIEEYSINDISPCNIKINGYSLGVVDWANPQRYPVRFYIAGFPDGYMNITDLNVFRKVEESKPVKPLLRIAKTDNNGMVTLTAEPLIKNLQDL